MERSIRVAQYGIGKQGSLLIDYLSRRPGVELVAAFARSSAQIGLDAGTAAGIGPIGVTVDDSARAEEILAQRGVDVCIMATTGSIRSAREGLLACARAKVNVITIGAEAAWPWFTDPVGAKELDEAFRANGVTLLGSGFPDVYWGSVVSILAAGSATVRELIGISCHAYDERYSEAELRAHGIGDTPEQFAQRTDPAAGFDRLPGDPVGMIAGALGLHELGHSVSTSGIIADADIEVPGRMTVRRGEVCGFNIRDAVETKEGMHLEFNVQTRVCDPAEHRPAEQTIWTLNGYPHVKMTLDGYDGQKFTSAIPVNRLPDVMNARPGLVTRDQLPALNYRVRPLNEYVREGKEGSDET